MSELFRFEFRRLFRRVSLYVCTGIAFLPALFIMLSTLMSTMMDGGSGMSREYYVQLIFMIGNLPTFVIIFTSIFGCEDYSKGTAKTIFSLGYPRWQHFVAKFTASNVAAALMYILIFSVSMIFTLFLPQKTFSANTAGEVNGLFGSSAPLYLIALQQLSSILAIHAFIFMFAELVRKTGIAIIIGIFAPGLVSGAVTVFCAIMNSITGAYDNFNYSETIFDKIMFFFNSYWLSFGTSGSVMNNLSGGMKFDHVLSIVINIGYIIIFGGLALFNMTKKEIK